MDIKKTCLTPITCETQGNGSGSCPKAGFDISGVESFEFRYQIQTTVRRYCLFTAICGGISKVAENPNWV